MCHSSMNLELQCPCISSFRHVLIRVEKENPHLKLPHKKKKKKRQNYQAVGIPYGNFHACCSPGSRLQPWPLHYASKVDVKQQANLHFKNKTENNVINATQPVLSIFSKLKHLQNGLWYDLTCFKISMIFLPLPLYGVMSPIISLLQSIFFSSVFSPFKVAEPHLFF